MKTIIISAGDVSLPAELNDSPTARQIWETLPIEGTAKIWGDEVYFEIPVVAGQEPDARAEVEVGELGYWPMGRAFCIFFGPTPASTDERPRAYSPVNVLGRVLGDVTCLRAVRDGARVRVAPDIAPDE
ncbi:MAG: cyclophilin-like fold protein [Chloroflexota bacterium]|nr:cyclophilin-like fold protein [Chloroflexota bacterium]